MARKFFDGCRSVWPGNGVRQAAVSVRAYSRM